MIKVKVLPADTYTLCCQSYLTDFDRKILTLLYQPIIGSLATNLYFTFWSEIGSMTSQNHYHLMVNTGLNLDLVIESLEKLEAIGLLKAYQNNDAKSIKKFMYVLYSPLSPYEFISSPLLNTLLLNNLGEDEYNKLISYFKKPKIDLTNYKDITCSFSDIFRINTESDLVVSNSDIQKIIKNSVNAESSINLNSLLDMIPDEILNKKSITKEQIDTINNLSFVYNFNEDDLQEILINSIGIDHKLDKDLFKMNSRNYYEFNHNGNDPKASYRKQPESLKTENIGTSNKEKMLYTCENTSPYDFLADEYNGVAPTKSDLKIIEYLIDEMKFLPAVVNVLIYFVLKTNNNKLTKSYIETIAGQWKRENINTARKAMDYAQKEFKARKKHKEKIPTWVNQDISSEIASKEEQEQISKMLKELVGE